MKSPHKHSHTLLRLLGYLAPYRRHVIGQYILMFAIIGLKMMLMPVLVFLACRYAVTLPPFWVKIAVLFAAMPTGANAFLFSQRNEEAVAEVSGAIALGTGLAAISASVLLYLMDTNVI